jgi:hypothetical protein
MSVPPVIWEWRKMYLVESFLRPRGPHRKNHPHPPGLVNFNRLWPCSMTKNQLNGLVSLVTPDWQQLFSNIEFWHRNVFMLQKKSMDVDPCHHMPSVSSVSEELGSPTQFWCLDRLPLEILKAKHVKHVADSLGSTIHHPWTPCFIVVPMIHGMCLGNFGNTK